MTLDLETARARANKWNALSIEERAEQLADWGYYLIDKWRVDQFARDVLALVEEVRHREYGAGLRCPTCGLIVVFTWGEKGAAPKDEPLCSPIRCPDCWVDGKSSLFSREPAEKAK